MYKMHSYGHTWAAAGEPPTDPSHPAQPVTGLGKAMLLLVFTGFAAFLPQSSLWAESSPASCSVNFTVESISLTDWDDGLGVPPDQWTVDTYDVVQPGAFDTPDWATVGSLPDSRTGTAAFAANLNVGACPGDDQSGVLTLTSPTIDIPAETDTPKIALNHWFDIEYGWDGGNLKISVNGGDFTLVPESAFETGPYTDVLFEAIRDFSPYNLNPLAEQEAFTGPGLDLEGGSWGVSRVNLAGIAAAGNSIQLRFDFGIDECFGAVGWYIDEVEVYSCMPSPPGLTIVKQVVNDNGGTAPVADFSITSSAGVLVFDAGATVGDTTTYTATPLTGLTTGVPYSLAEANVAGYTEGSWSCTPNAGGGAFDSGTVTLAVDEAATCTITNNDIAPVLTVIKQVVNDDGGTAPVADFSISSSAGVLVFDAGATVGDTTTYTATPLTGLTAGVGYTLAEVDVDGYTEGSWSCTPNVGGGAFDSGTVTLEPGEVASCTIINNDQSPGLTIVKQVVNDNGGTATVGDFSITSSAGVLVFDAGATVGDTTTYTATPLTGLTADVAYSLAEANADGYTEGSWSCSPNAGGGAFDSGTVTLAAGEAATCTIINNDQPPGLTIVKQVVNDNGGEASVADFSITSSAGALVFDAGSTDGDTTTFTTTPLTGLTAGVPYSLAEANVAGYTEGSWNCTPNAGGGAFDSGSVSLGLGEAATCTIINNDIAPSLTVIKQVVNDDGGTAPVADFSITSSAGVLVFDAGATVGDTTTYTATPLTGLTAGVGYSLTEANVAGYTEGNWSCTPNAGGGAFDSGSVTLEPGEVASCTIINNDQSPGLTIVKQVVNDDGGTATVDNFSISSSAGVLVFDAGATVGDTTTYTATPLTGLTTGVAYSLTEANVAGYTEGNWSCTPNAGGGAFDSGSVTLEPGETATCTIINNDEAPGLTVIKQVVNDDGGTATVDDFNISSSAGALIFDAGTTDGDTTTYTATPLTGLTTGESYSLAEANVTGYTEGSWSCSPNAGGGAFDSGTVTLAAGEAATCTIVNNDQAPGLTIVKQVINDNGGTAPVADFSISSSAGILIFDAGVTDGDTTTYTATPLTGLTAGESYTLAETNVADYTEGSWSCAPNVGGGAFDSGSVTLQPGEVATCTIINNDQSPGLTIVKQVVNDDGGTATVDNFSITSSAGALVFDAGATVGDTTTYTATPLTGLTADMAYSLAEANVAGYNEGSWSCSPNVGGGAYDSGTVTLAVGEAVTCIITNDDIVPSLTVIKQVDNQFGGTAVPGDFTMQINATNPSQASFPGADSPGTTISLDAGLYSVSESNLPSGYQLKSASADCSGSIAPGEVKTCTIINGDTNGDTSLILNKILIKDNGGTALESDWYLTASGGPTPIGGPGGPDSIDVQSGNDFAAGTYTLSESTGPDGYAADSWQCVGGAHNSETNELTLEFGEAATCTIINNDIAPSLTVIKQVVNDDGGTATVGDFSISSSAGALVFDAGSTDGDTTTYTATPLTDLTAGVPYSLAEANADGYAEGSWSCTPNAGGGAFDSGSVTLEPGETATCTIINNDIAPGLTVIKQVVNDDGGIATVGDFTISSSAGALVFDAGSTDGDTTTYTATPLTGLTSGVPYSLAEANADGYAEGSWSCTPNAGGGAFDSGSVTLEPGETATCTILNNDEAPGLTIVKQVVNDNGGTATVANFSISSSAGALVFDAGSTDGDTTTYTATPLTGLTSGVPYSLAEANVDGYTEGNWSCTPNTGGGAFDSGSVTLEPGETATCAIINNDEAPGLTIIKQVVNDNGGTATVANFSISSSAGALVFDAGSTDGDTTTYTATPLTGLTSGVPYSLAEANVDGYTEGNWSCTPNTGGGAFDSGSVTLEPGETATCAIINNDEAPGLTIIKQVVNDNGGTATVANFSISSSAGALVFDAGSTDGDTTTYTATPLTDLTAGVPYTLAEANVDGYTEGSWSCTPNAGGGAFDSGTITLAVGETATCTILNNDIAPSLAVIKQVVNDDGGIATVGDFSISSSAGALVFDAGSTDGDTTTYTATPLTDLTAGVSYTLAEVNVDGYTEGNWSCTPNAGGGAFDNGSVTLEPGETATCTILNNDIAPGLTVIKQVVNDDGGTATVDNFSISSSAGAVVFDAGSTDGDTTTYTATPLTDLTAGVPYSLAEANVDGYTEGNWSCTPNAGGGAFDNGTITLAVGETATCTILNNDEAPGLTIVKQVVNDNGGTATVGDFSINSSAGALVFDAGSTDGDTTTYTATPLTGLTAGVSYSLAEANVDGYTEGNWSCTPNAGGGAYDIGTVTLAVGEAVTCSIINNDIAPSLTVIKQVINDDGGKATVSDFSISSSAGALVFDAGTTDGDITTYTATSLTDLAAEVSYSLAEANLFAYTEGTWSCTPNAGGGAFDSGSVSLELGESAICIITNDDMLLSEVIFDDGFELE